MSAAFVANMEDVLDLDTKPPALYPGVVQDRSTLTGLP